MGHFEERLNQVLAGYATFLREKELPSAKHQPYLVRWVREFLLFARDHGGYTFEQTPNLFLAEVGGLPASSAPRTLVRDLFNLWRLGQQTGHSS